MRRRTDQGCRGITRLPAPSPRYYAATDGVLAAISGRIVDTSVRTSGIATAQTIVAAARFASSLGFGLLWTELGRVHALLIVSLLLVRAIPAAGLLVTGIDPRDSAIGD